MQGSETPKWSLARKGLGFAPEQIQGQTRGGKKAALLKRQSCSFVTAPVEQGYPVGRQ